jgi:hypothetical protein
MEDWKGNTIKKGDIVKIYMYRYMFSGSEMSLVIIDRNGRIQETAKTTIPEEYVWVLCNTYKIIGGTTFIIKEDTKPDEVVEMPLCCFDFMINANGFCHAICIEGVSDNRDDFMIKHFSS